MLLRSVRLENFRAIRSAAISLEQPATLLIGENDCGRSSVMEAIALALGWNCDDGEFRFQPYHSHLRAANPGSPPALFIGLEFAEGQPGEWDSDTFAPLRAALPAVLKGPRRVRFEVTHAAGCTHWTFRSGAERAQPDDRVMLTWLRRHVPVFWMTDGIVATRGQSAALDGPLAEQVGRLYGELLQGTAVDVPRAIETGAAAARELLLTHAKLAPGRTTSMDEVLEQITGRRKPRVAGSPGFGSAAHKIGILLLVGSLLRSGAARIGQGVVPLTLMEDPEAHLHPTTLASIWSLIDSIGGQKIIATHSGTLLSRARLSSVRRLTRQDGVVREWRVPEDCLTGDELRRYTYHLRSRRAAASFARCWLLVEGETEYWLMGELARISGYDFASEGVACVEFAQCGLSALIKVAECLGIEWHVLTDGDQAGQQYARTARDCARGASAPLRITGLEEPDVEHCFWHYGYEAVFRKAAFPGDPDRRAPARVTIRRALERRSKPYVAALLLDTAIDRGRDGIPPPLRHVVETCIRLARHGLDSQRTPKAAGQDRR